MDPDDLGMVQETLALLADRLDDVAADLYAELFATAPQLRGMFPPGMADQRARFLAALTTAVAGLADEAAVRPVLARLGRDHRRFGVRPEHYDVFGRALVAAVGRAAQDVWVPELEAAWRRTYAVVAGEMIAGARDAEAREPAWWRAQIVAHERRAHDLAVIRLRTDRPYTYEPGQYTAVETPYRPRTWRTYSFATATPVDGLLELHVRAVDAGWVSGLLVRRGRVGDELRLGAPAGAMRIEHASQRDVLLVAGGTGLAPIKAMVTGMARWNTARRVTVMVGARTREDLYDLPALEQLAAAHPWLSVVPAVSEGVAPRGRRSAGQVDGVETGLLPDVVARRGSWVEHDVVVSGPPAMTRATVSRLVTLGVPTERIAYDPPPGTAAPAPGPAQVIDLRRAAGSPGSHGGHRGHGGHGRRVPG